MKKLFFLILVFTISGLNLNAVEPTENEKLFLQKELKDVAVELNKNVPYMVDKITQLDKVIVDKNAVIYNYTIIAYAKADFHGNMEVLFEGIQLNYETQICQRKSGYFLLEKGAVFKYAFSDKNGDYLSGFEISIKNCDQ